MLFRSNVPKDSKVPTKAMTSEIWAPRVLLLKIILITFLLIFIIVCISKNKYTHIKENTMAFKAIRTYTLPENSNVTFYQESVEFRTWFEENWAGGGKHISTETSISDDGKSLTKTVTFVDQQSFLEYASSPEVRTATELRNFYNATNMICNTTAYQVVEDDE